MSTAALPNEGLPWQELFAPGAPGDRPTSVELRVIRRTGQPLLLQPAVSGRREEVARLIPRVERLLASDDFIRYARHARIAS